MSQLTTTTILTSDIKKLICSFDGLILEKLGFSNINQRGIQQACPIHDGDNPAAFSYDRNKCCWSCFTHGCHNKFGNDIIGLVRAVKNLSFSDAISWIESVINDPEITAGYIPSVKALEQKNSNEPIEESQLLKLNPDFSSIKDRGFSQTTLEHFQCGTSDKKSKIQHHRLMIPIRNADGFLIGFTGRSIYPKCERTGAYHPNWANEDGTFSGVFTKWRHYPKGLNKSIELYNFHEAKRYIERVGFAVVVEGPFDLWRMWEFGVKNCVAAYGCSISSTQISILKEIANCAAVCFDNDDAGMAGFQKAKTLHSDRIKIEKIALPNGKDPGSLTAEDYNCIIKPQLSVLRNRYEIKNHNNNW